MSTVAQDAELEEALLEACLTDVQRRKLAGKLKIAKHALASAEGVGELTKLIVQTASSTGALKALVREALTLKRDSQSLLAFAKTHFPEILEDLPDAPPTTDPRKRVWYWVLALILGIGLSASVAYWVGGRTGSPTILVMSGSVYNWLKDIRWHDGIPGIRGIPKDSDEESAALAENLSEVKRTLDPSTVMLDVGSKDALNVISRTYRHGTVRDAWTAAPVAAMGVGIPEIMINSTAKFAWLPLFKTRLVLYVENKFLHNCAVRKEESPCAEFAAELLFRKPKTNNEAAWIDLSEFWDLINTCKATSADKEHQVNAVYVPSGTSGTLERLNIAFAAAGEDIIPRPEAVRDSDHQFQSARDEKKPEWIVWTLDYEYFTQDSTIAERFGRRMLIANDTSTAKPPKEEYKGFFFTHKGEEVDEQGWVLVPVIQLEGQTGGKLYVMPDNLGNVLESIRTTANAPTFCWDKDLKATKKVGTWGVFRRLSQRMPGWNYELSWANDSPLETGQKDMRFVVPKDCTNRARELAELIQLRKAHMVEKQRGHCRTSR